MFFSEAAVFCLDEESFCSDTEVAECEGAELSPVASSLFFDPHPHNTDAANTINNNIADNFFKTKSPELLEYFFSAERIGIHRIHNVLKAVGVFSRYNGIIIIRGAVFQFGNFFCTVTECYIVYIKDLFSNNALDLYILITGSCAVLKLKNRITECSCRSGKYIFISYTEVQSYDNR